MTKLKQSGKLGKKVFIKRNTAYRFLIDEKSRNLLLIDIEI